MNNYDYVNNNYLSEPYEGFVRGNLFNNLYNGYKNYKPMVINPSNDKDYLMTLVQIYTFCTHELTLYLDNYPNDTNIINLRNNYVKALDNAVNNYEVKYGPISLSSSSLSKVPWAWDTDKWPWEVGF